MLCVDARQSSRVHEYDIRAFFYAAVFRTVNYRLEGLACIARIDDYRLPARKIVHDIAHLIYGIVVSSVDVVCHNVEIIRRNAPAAAVSGKGFTCSFAVITESFAQSLFICRFI